MDCRDENEMLETKGVSDTPVDDAVTEQLTGDVACSTDICGSFNHHHHHCGSSSAILLSLLAISLLLRASEHRAQHRRSELSPRLQCLC